MNGFPRATRMSTCRPTRRRPRLADCASGSMPGAAAILGRVEASVSTTAVGTAAATSTVTPAAAWPGRPGFAASSSTSAGEPPDPPGAAAAEAGVPGGRKLPNPPSRLPEAYAGWPPRRGAVAGESIEDSVLRVPHPDRGPAAHRPAQLRSPFMEPGRTPGPRLHRSAGEPINPDRGEYPLAEGKGPPGCTGRLATAASTV